MIKNFRSKTYIITREHILLELAQPPRIQKKKRSPKHILPEVDPCDGEFTRARFCINIFRLLIIIIAPEHLKRNTHNEKKKFNFCGYIFYIYIHKLLCTFPTSSYLHRLVNYTSRPCIYISSVFIQHIYILFSLAASSVASSSSSRHLLLIYIYEVHTCAIYDGEYMRDHQQQREHVFLKSFFVLFLQYLCTLFSSVRSVVVVVAVEFHLVLCTYQYCYFIQKGRTLISKFN